MKRIFIVLTLAIGVLVGAAATPGVEAQQVFVVGDAYDFETITVGATAGRASATKTCPTGELCARALHCTVETDAIRYRFDGTDPTATVGHKVAADQYFWVVGINNVRRLRMIRVTADATAHCSFIR